REIFQGRPAEFGANFRRINGIAEVMSRSVGDKGDLIAIGAAVTAWRVAIEQSANLPNEVDVAALRSGPDIVCLPRLPLSCHRQQRARMIFHVDPVANVFASSIDWNWSIAKRAADNG